MKKRILPALLLLAAVLALPFLLRPRDGRISGLLEKHDTLALILSAMITILPVALLFLCVISAIAYFFIVR